MCIRDSYCKLEIVELEDEKTPDRASEAEEVQIKKKEGERILKAVKDGTYTIALAIEGKKMTSEPVSYTHLDVYKRQI